jgi:hypothetical protein
MDHGAVGEADGKQYGKESLEHVHDFPRARFWNDCAGLLDATRGGISFDYRHTQRGNASVRSSLAIFER